MRYLRQAWQLLKQNRFYSAIYILATGLSITIVMVLAIVIYLKLANIYPETGRDRLLIIKNAQTTTADGSNGQSYLALEVIRQCVYPLQTAEAVTAVLSGGGDNYVQPDNTEEQIPVTLKSVDTGFWEVFSFSFTEGQPFTEADMQSGIQTAVISESFARRLFGRTDVVGSYVSLNFDSYRICGVVKDAPYIADKTFAHLWIPYTVHPGIESAWYEDYYGKTLGGFTAYLLASSKGEVSRVKEEAQANLQRYASTLGDLKFTVNGQPDRQWQSLFRLGNGQDIDSAKILWQHALLFLVFLLIPAVSLSGMADSQMERRLSEMGIRRAFGAPQGNLTKQLVAENLLFTLLGGMLGLLISYLVVYFSREWIIHIGLGQTFVDLVPEGVDVLLSPSMLINYTVFGISLVICLVLNLMVTVIPAWRSSRREIVYSLHN